MDAAESLYDDLKRDGLALIRSFMSEHRPEDPLLDFKTVAPGCPPMQSPDRNNLADAISGFTNADGGVIVWGVRATEGTRKNPGVAMNPQVIERLDLFVRDLQRQTSQVTAPHVTGVLHHGVEDAPGSNRGFAVTYVPKGEGEPVQRRDDCCYYVRIGDSFMPMPHSMISDRFGRRPRPKLELTHFLTPQGGRSSSTGMLGLVVITFGVTNAGRGVARFPMLSLRPQRRFDDSMEWAPGPTGLPARPEVNPDPEDHWERHVFASGAGEVIHPGTALQVCRLRLWLEKSLDVGWLTVDYALHCEGFAHSDSLTIEGHRIMDCRDRALHSM